MTLKILFFKYTLEFIVIYVILLQVIFLSIIVY